MLVKIQDWFCCLCIACSLAGPLSGIQAKEVASNKKVISVDGSTTQSIQKTNQPQKSSSSKPGQLITTVGHLAGRLAGSLAGIGIGTWVRIVKKVGSQTKEIQEGLNIDLGDTTNPILNTTALGLAIIPGFWAGLTEGAYDGVARGAMDGFNKPFSKDSFGLENE